MAKKLFSLLLWGLFLLPLLAQEIIFERYESGIDIWIILPYELILFGAEDAGAEYQVSTQIKDSRGKQVAVNEQTLEIPKRDWLQDAAIPVQQTHNLPTGSYTLNVTLRNRKLGDKQNYERSFNVGSQATEIGQAYLIAEREGFHYIPSTMALDKLQSLLLRISFAVDVQSLRLTIDGSRNDFDLLESPFEIDLKELAQRDTIEDLNIALTEMNIRYQLEPLLYRPWFSFGTRYSLKDQLNQLRYVASQNDWRVLSRVPKNKYHNAIESFWQANDPTPGTIRNENRELFNQRVLQADEKFTLHKRLQGWKSDRGRIYIKFGDPDQITTEAFPIGRAPSISWHYFRLNRVFVFADERGFGQYTLRNKDEEYYDL
ncbi:MAG: GWxTD domain-containing protein [Candidatus Cloacimonetes bacterium]|nr:GWxTD domain-containing protein [Candidatus Cloacimonadota bacterium]MDY0171448.1 GWxTD domain-containing protein [Candidatus Cloacimonadaceae bacterium]